MKKMLTFLMASAMTLGMASAADTFMYSHYFEDFSTVATGDWGSVDVNGAAARTGAFNVNGTNKNLELKPGGSVGKPGGMSAYKQVWQTPITSTDSVKISFIFQNNATISSATQYLFFLDSNKKPIFGINADRSKPTGSSTAQWMVRLPSLYKNFADSTSFAKAFNSSDPQMSATGGAFKMQVTLHFDTHTYSIHAQKGTYTATANPIFVANTDAPFIVKDKPFLDQTASDISWLINTIANTSTSSSYNSSSIWGNIDSLTVEQEKPYVGDAYVSVNSVDQNGAVIRTSQVMVPIGQKYQAVSTATNTFELNGKYYYYDAANTTSTSTTCTSDGLAAINLKFMGNNSQSGPFVWHPNSTSGNWNEFTANFLSAENNQIGYQSGREVIFNGSATKDTVTITQTVDLGDKNMTVNGGKFLFTGSGSVKTTGNLNLNVSTGDSLYINNKNLLSGNVVVKGGYIQLTAGAIGSGAVKIDDNAEIYLKGGYNDLTNTTIADGKVLTISTSNENEEGISGNLYGAGELKINLNNLRGHLGCNMSQWAGQKITVVSKAGSTSNQILMITSDAARDGLYNKELYLDSLIQVGAAYTANQTCAIGALSGTPKAVLGALTNVANGNKKTFYKIGGLNTNTEYAGTISDAQYRDAGIDTVYVEKVGTGSLTLSSKNLIYKGNTTVSEGNLILKGKLTEPTDTVFVKEGAKLVVIGKRELDALGVMQQTGGIIAGSVKVAGTLESQGGNYNGTGLYLNGTSKFVAKVESDSVPCATFQFCMIEPSCTLEIAPVVSYKVGDKFRVFSADAITNGIIAGAFGSVVDAEKWDVTNLLVDGTVVALDGRELAVNDLQKEQIRAYFTEGMLQVAGLESGDTYKVVNTSGVLVDSTVKMPKGLYIVVVKTAKGNVKLKVANF